MKKSDSIDYVYFLHKTNIEKDKIPETVESYFNDGLKSCWHYSIHSTLFPIEDEYIQKYGLEQSIMNYLGDGGSYNSVVVVKIPERYLGYIKHRDYEEFPPIPLFREYNDGYKLNNIKPFNAVFTPKLIQGVYCKEIDKAFTNPNFNPIFYPNGCQFSEEQIEAMYAFAAAYYFANQYVDYAKKRSKIPLQQLYEHDKINGTWNEIMSNYSNRFGIKPTNMVHYEMSDEDKKLCKSNIK